MIKKGTNPINEILYLKNKYKKIGKPCVRVFVMMKVVPHNKVVRIKAIVEKNLNFNVV